MPSPPARYIFKEAFVMEAANYALLAAAVSIILWIVVALVGGAVGDTILIPPSIAEIPSPLSGTAIWIISAGTM